jgi:hypothetical protein
MAVAQAKKPAHPKPERARQTFMSFSDECPAKVRTFTRPVPNKDEKMIAREIGEVLRRAGEMRNLGDDFRADLERHLAVFARRWSGAGKEAA